MATEKGEVTIRGRFAPGTKVELHERGSADVYAGATGGKVASATTNRDGETTFSAPYGNYFAVATVEEWNHVLGRSEERTRAVDVTINRPAEPDEAPLPIGPEPPAQTGPMKLVMGARSSVDGDVMASNTQLVDPATGAVSEFASPIGAPLAASDLPKHGVPHPRQEDHRGTELASSTLTGQAVIPQGLPRPQADVPKKVEQASDTEQGYEVPAAEIIRQEDFRGPQASDTATGEAYPVGLEETPITSQDQPPAVAGKRGSSRTNRGTRDPEGRGSKASVKKAVKGQKKANRSKQNQAAKRSSSSPRRRSRADTAATDTPATDVRGVEHVEAPESTS
jgi:hypothetical protein